MDRSARAAVAGSVAAVAGSYLAVRTGVAARIDDPGHRLLTEHHGPVRDRIVGVLTDVGSIYALAGVAGSLALARRRTAATDLAVSGVGAWIAAQSAKPLLDRPRPYELRTAARVVAPPAGSSWPSGHAALVAAMTDAIWPHAGVRTRTALVTLTAAVGLSRCYVGVHHVTDIVAGLGVGVLSNRTSAWLRARSSGGPSATGAAGVRRR